MSKKTTLYYINEYILWNGELDITSRVGILVHEWKFKTTDKVSELSTGALGNDNGRTYFRELLGSVTIYLCEENYKSGHENSRNRRSTYDPDICP